MLHLASAERRHRVLASVIDYAGEWGTGAFRYFSPTTGWRPARLRGYEEKALEGMELTAGVDVTSTLDLSATGYRWGAEDGSDRWNEGVRLGIGWRPHPWLEFGARHDRPDGSDGASSVFARISVPFGGPAGPAPRWEGLGLAAGGSAPGVSSLWRPVEGVGRIRVATRRSPARLVAEAQVRILEDRVESGDAVHVEVVLPAPAPEDIGLSIRLAPGGGDNPAVAGEDYVDEAIGATIAEGSNHRAGHLPALAQ